MIISWTWDWSSKQPKLKKFNRKQGNGPTSDQNYKSLLQIGHVPYLDYDQIFVQSTMWLNFNCHTLDLAQILVAYIGPCPDFNCHTLNHVQILVAIHWTLSKFQSWTLSNSQVILIIGSCPMHNWFWSPCGQGSTIKNQLWLAKPRPRMIEFPFDRWKL